MTVANYFVGEYASHTPEMGDYGGNAPVIPHFSVCEAYALAKIIATGPSLRKTNKFFIYSKTGCFYLRRAFGAAENNFTAGF